MKPRPLPPVPTRTPRLVPTSLMALGIIAAVGVVIAGSMGSATTGVDPSTSGESFEARSAPATPLQSGGASPTDSAAPTDVAMPSAVTESAFVAAFADRQWTAQDPKTGDWIVGAGSKTIAVLALGRGHPRASWSRTAYTSNLSGQVTAGYIDSTGAVEEWAVAGDIDTTTARMDPTGTRIFVHGGREGQDHGVVAIDTADGTVTQIVPGGPIAEDYSRNYLVWSPSGKTLMSTLCNLKGCFVDVIDTKTSTFQRLPEPSPAIVVTDRYLLGRLEPGTPWLVRDLRADATDVLPLDRLLNAQALVALDDDHVVIDRISPNDYEILKVDLASGEVVVLYTESTSPTKNLRLMRMPPVDGRWALISEDSSIGDRLSRDGTFPTIFGLDTTTGKIDSGQITITDTLSGS